MRFGVVSDLAPPFRGFCLRPVEMHSAMSAAVQARTADDGFITGRQDSAWRAVSTGAMSMFRDPLSSIQSSSSGSKMKL